MADTQDLKSCGLTAVWVRLPLRAQSTSGPLGRRPRGAFSSVVEHPVYIRQVGGSNPSAPTQFTAR